MDLDQRIFKSNSLIESKHRLEICENRIILSVIAQIRRNEPLTDDRYYKVKAGDIAEMAGIPPTLAYRDLKRGADSILSRVLVVPYAPDGGKPMERKFHWVQECAYNPREGHVLVRLSKPILPYLSELSERFTVYQLRDVIRMNSAHAVRLYELLMQWRGAGVREVEIDWLKAVFEVDGKYKSVKDFKKNVIDIAVRQINEHSPLEVKWGQRKTGRRVTHLRFTFAPKSKPSPAPSKKPTAIPKALLDKFRQPGDSDEKAAQRVRAARQRAEG